MTNSWPAFDAFPEAVNCGVNFPTRSELVEYIKSDEIGLPKTDGGDWHCGMVVGGCSLGAGG
jgi:hypothetical protein